jgi:hypothetical protein
MTNSVMPTSEQEAKSKAKKLNTDDQQSPLDKNLEPVEVTEKPVTNLAVQSQVN